MLKSENKKLFFSLLLVLTLAANYTLAQNLNSTNYRIENPTLDAGGGIGSSTNFRSTDAVGDTSAPAGSSSNYKALLGFIFPSFPGVPAQPSLTNTGGSLYNSLDFIVATGGNQTDTTYAIAISSDDFATTYYIQTDDTLGASEAWQTYANWGNGSGERVTGLAANTTYKIKVKARYGPDSETGFSVTASAATANPSLSVTYTGISTGTSVDGATTNVTTQTNAIPFGTVAVSTAKIAAHKITVSTNATLGYTTTIHENNNPKSTQNKELDDVSGSNASPGTFPGSISHSAFGYHTTDDTLCTGTQGRFSADDTYAAITSTASEFACSTSGVTNEDTTLVYKLLVGPIQESGDYTNRLVYITTARY